jgi:hypothetical protein
MRTTTSPTDANVVQMRTTCWWSCKIRLQNRSKSTEDNRTSPLVSTQYIYLDINVPFFNMCTNVIINIELYVYTKLFSFSSAAQNRERDKEEDEKETQ